jgi:hypothetical protein
MSLNQLREEAKKQGFKQAFNMSEETLKAKLNINEQEEPKIVIGSSGLGLLEHFGISIDFVEQVRVANGWDQIKYNPLRKAFNCFVSGDLVGSVSMEDILLKGGAR